MSVKNDEECVSSDVIFNYSLTNIEYLLEMSQSLLKIINHNIDTAHFDLEKDLLKSFYSDVRKHKELLDKLCDIYCLED